MRRHRFVVVALAGVVAAVATPGSEPGELRRIFPQRAALFLEQDGLARLLLPAEVLAACRPDLSDVRVFDSAGREVPFMVDAGRPVRDAREVIQRFSPSLSNVSRAEIRREDGPPLRRETFEFDLPQAPPRAETWVLVAEVGAVEFVARLQVEGIAASGEVTPLVVDGSIFRLPRIRGAEKLRLLLPSFGGAGLRIILESEHRSWLDPALRLESASTYEGGGRVAVSLQVLSNRSSRGSTTIDLARPRGITPDLLRLQTATGTFDRTLEIWDHGPGSAAQALGSGRVFRVEGLVSIGDDEVPLHPARGDRLRVEIDDGDSPPLSAMAFHAVIRRPALIFAMTPSAAGSRSGYLHFGGGRAHQPRYDLSRLLPLEATGKRAQAAAFLHDPQALGTAHLGEAEVNPDYDGTPALAFAMRASAALDRRIFSHSRRLRVPAAAEGLSRLRLQPADLAVLRDDLSDLRVADHAAHQWPYLVEREAVVELVSLMVEGPVSREGSSSYALNLPVPRLRFDRLLLDTDPGYFDRGYRLEARVGDESDRVLVRGRLARPVGDPRAINIDMPPSQAESLRLIIDDGDDAPLVLRSVQVRVLLPELYLTAPEGDYTLLLGAPEEAAPRYELERVRDIVLAVRAEPIMAGLLSENPDFSFRARLRGWGVRRTVLFWAVLLLAVGVLGFMTLRLARRESVES